MLYIFGLGLKCYTCSKGNDDSNEGDCTEPFNATNNDKILKTCAAAEVWCKVSASSLHIHYYLPA